MVLLHLLGWEKELQLPPVLESLELKTVPGVYHEEMATRFRNAQETRVQQLAGPQRLSQTWGLYLPPSLLPQRERRDPHVCWARARPGPCALEDVDEFLDSRQVSPMVTGVGSAASRQEGGRL